MPQLGPPPCIPRASEKSQALGTRGALGESPIIWECPGSLSKKQGIWKRKTKTPNPKKKPQSQHQREKWGKLGSATGAVPMRTTCVRGIPGICDARVIRGIAHHTAVVWISRESLCRSQEETVQGRVVAPRDFSGCSVKLRIWSD